MLDLEPGWLVEGGPPYFSLVLYDCFVISSNVGEAQVGKFSLHAQ